MRYNTDRLIELGLISARLSGNYRRGGQRGKDGTILWASGLDMKPAIERLAEFQAIANEPDRQDQTRVELHKKISSYRGELRSIIANHCPQFFETAEKLLNIRSRRTWAYDRLMELWQSLEELWKMILDFLDKEKAPDDHQNCRHDQNSCSQGCSQLPTLYKTTTQETNIIVEPSDGKPSLAFFGGAGRHPPRRLPRRPR